mgnify:CR=1 FL=1
MDIVPLLNLSINETLSRTVMTSATTLLALLALIVLVPNPLSGRLLAAGISGAILAIGAILKHRGMSQT